MTLEEILTNIYNREQNVKISCFWHGGWTVCIGDDVNGYIDSQGGDFDTIEALRDYLISWYDDRRRNSEPNKEREESTRL